MTSSTAPDSDSEGHSTNELQAPRQTLATEDLAQHLSSSVLGRPLSEQAHDEADGLLISTIGRQPRLPENLSDRATVLRMNILRLWRLETGNGMPLLISRCKQQIWMAEQDLSYLAHYVVPNKGGRLEIMKQDRHTLKDKLQLQLEHSTGLAWDWWPLSAPRKPLARGMLRIRWEMVSPKSRFANIAYVSTVRIRTLAINTTRMCLTDSVSSYDKP